ncbi:MAG: pilus assembly protein PilM [Deltaproteobacteria bacterium]|nr:pilus assembly protein PilM [Deltaproteobacteria bacterium]
MKILSLDIGSYSLKAVEFDVSFGRIELGDYLIEHVIENELQEVQSEKPKAPESGDPAAPTADAEAPAQERQILTSGQINALKRLLSDRHFKFDKLIVNIPRAWITTRMQQYPTKDRKTIQNSLNFELDDDIPFSMTDVIYDFAMLPSEGTGSTVFTAVALRADLTSLLVELQMQGLDPDALSIESWGLAHVLKRAIPKDYEGRPVCVVNLGNKHTSIHMFVGESPVLTHTSTCAGFDVTRAIAQSYNLSFEEADKAKVDGAFLLTTMHMSGDAGGEPITKDQRQFAGVISDALTPLIREIKQTLMSYKANFKMQPRAIFITGGTSLIPNMQLFLEEQLQLPVFPLTYMSRVVGQTLQLSEQSEAQISSAAGLGLSIVKVDRNYHINFRKDGLAKRGGMGAFDLSMFRRPLKYVAASLLFVYLNLIAQGLILSSRSTKQQGQLVLAMKSVLGPLKDTVISTYTNSPSTLKNAVNKEIAKYKSVTASTSKPGVSAFDILNKLSSTMPRGTEMGELDVSVFQVKDGKFKLSGLVNSSAAPARILKALEETKMLDAIIKDKTEEDPKTKKVKFEFNAKVVGV